MRKIEIKNWHFFHNYVIILSHQNFHNFLFHSQPLKIEYLKRQGWISYKVGKVEISRQEDSIFNIIFRIPRFSDFSVSLAFNFFFLQYNLHFLHIHYNLRHSHLDIELQIQPSKNWTRQQTESNINL